MIRIATRNDIPRISEIELFVSRYNFKDIFSNDFLYKKLTYEYHKNWLEKSFADMENNCGIFYYVLEDEDIIKAYFSMGFPENNVECELLHFIIDVPFQNKKYGTLIMNYCFETLNSKGIKVIRLQTFEKNFVAIKFYEKVGFKIEDNYFSKDLGIKLLKLKKIIE